MKMAWLKTLAKQCLSIISSSNIKDDEIEMWINMAIADMKRLGIDVEDSSKKDLIEGAIMMYVKGNFGNTDISEKELCQSSYKMHLAELQLYSKEE